MEWDSALKKIMKGFSAKNKLPKELMDASLEYFSVRKELITESNRGCALLATSQLEIALEKLLRKKIVGNKKHKDSLFNLNGSLGTFSSKVQISYSIGLISKIEKDDLNLIRKIRNEFGHSYRIIDFEDEKIKLFCDKIQLYRPSNKTNRSKFLSSVSFILGGVIGQTYKEGAFKELKSMSKEEVFLNGMSADNFVTEFLNNDEVN